MNVNAGGLTGLSDEEIDRAIERYVREMGRYEEAARVVERRLRVELRRRGLLALVCSRAKHPDDLRRKLVRKRGDPRVSSEQLERDVGLVVADLAGCRVLTYRRSDIEQLERAALDVLSPAPREDWLERHAKPSGYRATHILVRIDGHEERPWVRGAVCEVQIASLASHVFNEIEHDLVYKRASGPPKAARAALEDVFDACLKLDEAVEHPDLEATPTSDGQRRQS